MSYSGAITREQWLLREMRIVARLRVDEGADDAAIVERVRSENLFQYPTDSKLGTIARACLTRLDALSEDAGLGDRLVRLLAHGAPEQVRQVNLYALMCADRLVWEFMLLAVGERYRSRDLVLSKREIGGFLEGLRSSDERVAHWSDATLAKIKQVLNKCLVEAGFKPSVRSDALQGVYLDEELAGLMVQNGDACALPAFNCFRAVG